MYSNVLIIDSTVFFHTISEIHSLFDTTLEGYDTTGWSKNQGLNAVDRHIACVIIVLIE